MIAYLDASVVLRVVLEAPEPLREWPRLEQGISSALLRVECYRTLERLWHHGELTDEELERHRLQVSALIGRLQTLDVGNEVLTRAAEPFPTHLKTLDAVHLATALLFRRSPAGESQRVVFATHDKQLAHAAREMHFDVIGT